MSVKSQMTLLANAIRSKSGKTGSLTIDGMISAVNSITVGNGGTSVSLPNGFSAYDSGSFTLDADATVTRTINHSLGLTPNFFVVYAETDTYVGENYVSFAAGIRIPPEMGSGFVVSSYGLLSTRSYTFNASNNSFEVTTTTGKYKAGVTYHWFTGVLTALS